MKHTSGLAAGALAAGLLLAGCTEGPVEFAAIVPLSGHVETYGTSIKQGIELAYAEAQARDDLPWEVELEILDSESDAEEAAAKLAEAYEQGAIAAIGGVTSSAALEMVPVADRKEKILVSPSASSPELSGVSRYFFRVFPSDFVEGTKMGNFAANTLRLEDLVILATETAFGRGIQGVVRGEFERHGGEVVEVIETPATTSDYSGIVDRIVTLEPDGVYIAAYWQDVVTVIRALREAGYDGKILTTAAFATPTAIEAAGEYAEGVYFTQTIFDVTSDAEPIRGFVERYRATHGVEPDLYAAHGYDAMRVLINALEEGEQPTAHGIWKGLRFMRSFPGVTGTLQFDEKGDIQKFPRVYVIKDGTPMNYEEHVRRVREALQDRLRELEAERRQLGTGR